MRSEILSLIRNQETSRRRFVQPLAHRPRHGRQLHTQHTAEKTEQSRSYESYTSLEYEHYHCATGVSIATTTTIIIITKITIRGASDLSGVRCAGDVVCSGEPSERSPERLVREALVRTAVLQQEGGHLPTSKMQDGIEIFTALHTWT